MKNTKLKITRIIILGICMASVPSQAAISIIIAGVNATSGQILDSNQAIVTNGFIRVGKITGSMDLTKVAPTFENFSYWDAKFVDVNDPLGGGGSTPSAWNFNSSGGLSGSSSGISVSINNFAVGTQMYIWAFKVTGKTLTDGVAGTNGIPALSASDFTAGVEWALLTADEWIAPADLGSKALTIKDIAPTDLRLSAIIGQDLGNSVTMIPEPSSASLLAIGVAGLVALRVRRKS